MERIKIAICDDEQSDLNRLENLVSHILREEKIESVISVYDSSSALLRTIEEGTVFSILLLDVVMPELDGMALAAALRRQGSEAAIIFISSNREMALKGYEVSALRYLAKPVAGEKLREALLYCCHTLCSQKEILLPTDKGQTIVSISDILYAESQNHSTRLILTNTRLTANLMISGLAQLLPGKQFIFCHRTVLVNLEYVQDIHRSQFTLKNGTILPISKYRLPEVKAQLLRYLGM